MNVQSENSNNDYLTNEIDPIRVFPKDSITTECDTREAKHSTDNENTVTANSFLKRSMLTLPE